MEVIEIRHRVILDAMLDELNLPRSTSQAVFHTDGTVSVTLKFFPTTMSLQHSNGQYSSESYARSSVRDAENEAVLEAIQYMECVERKTPKDYNYYRVQNKKKLEANLFHQLSKKEKQSEDLTGNWNSFISGVHAASERISKVGLEMLCETMVEEGCRIGSALLELQKATSDLKELTLLSSELLRATGTYRSQSDADISRDAELRNSYVSGLKYCHPSSVYGQNIDDADE